MGTGRKRGHSGGASLNFKVVGNPQPTSAKENTIWLDTDTKITSYYFQPTQPENMQPGEVWISTGASSQVAFNALKKNTVMVYPISAKQMGQDGTLVDVTAKSWQNGEWVEWMPEGALYYRGHEVVEKTGGWSAVAYTPNQYYTNAGLTFDKNSDHMSLGFSDPSTTSRDWYIYSNNKISMTQYNDLRIDAKHSFKECDIRLSDSKPSASSMPNSVASAVLSQTRGETTLDVSDCNESYYVVVRVYTVDVTSADIDIFGIIAE